MIIPDVKAGEIRGALRLSRLINHTSLATYGAEQEIVYRGGQVKFIPMTFQAPAEPGGYRFTFAGTHTTTNSAAGWFAVSSSRKVGPQKLCSSERE